MAAAGLMLAAVLVAGCATRTGGEPVGAGSPSSSGSSGSDAPATTSSDGTAAADPCEFTATPGEDAPVGLPPHEDTPASSVLLETNTGDLTITLNPEAAPCTVRSFVHLASEGFYTDTKCHRLTASAGLKVLQCGDPKGDGTGGPGYSIPDELPTTLTPAPGAAPGAVGYPRGTVAMANAGPDTGGSQFFLVYGDSTLSPDYSVFGTLDPTGLAALDVVAAAGVAPGGMSSEDGAPNKPVSITSAKVS